MCCVAEANRMNSRCVNLTANLREELPLRGGHIGVAGLFRTRCGLQRGARLMLRDLRHRGYVAHAIDLSQSLGARLHLDEGGLLLPSDVDELGLTDLLIHCNPPLFAHAVSRFSERVRNRVHLVAYWTWELTVVSDEWRESARLCSSIWVPSPFVAHSLLAELPDFGGEIHVVPHQVDRDPLRPLDAEERREIREKHGIRSEAFVCGAAFSFDSNYMRKNPLAAVDAFTRAFSPLDEKCKLFIRCQESADFGELYDHLVSYAAGDPRIHVFDAASQPWPIGEFLASLDVFISLHRSEGYGLQIAEAAQAGVPVLATAWGLAPDIAVRPEVRSIGYRLVSVLDPQRFYTGLSGARWAEPDIDDAVRWLRRLREMHHATITGRRSGLGGRLDMSNRHTFPQ